MKYKVGDKVKIKSLDWYNENKNDTGRVVCGNLSLGCLNKGFCGKVFTIDKVYIDHYTVKENSAYWNDMMIEGLAEDEIIDLTSIVMKTVEDKTIQNALTYGYNLPEGYQFVDENGNVINATKIILEKKNIIREEQIDNAAQELTYSDGFCEQTDHPFVRAALKAGVEWEDNNVTRDDCSKAPKLTSQDYSNGRFGYRLPAGFEAKLTERELILTPEKKEYPKTFRECQKYLGEDVPPMEEPVSKTHRRRQVHLLEVLLICRDAYWKIAGDEMGLGKSWEPDWENKIYYVYYERHRQYGIGIKKAYSHCGIRGNRILVFPTEEMVNAFYENFKELIESCKELL